MRTVALVAVLVVASPALADRGTVVTLGAMLDGRSTASTFTTASNQVVNDVLGGARLTLSFEDAPPPLPPAEMISSDLRLAPELLAGFLADDTHAEGYVGAGVRGELWLASARRGFQMRTAIYLAARAIVIGGHQDGAAELAMGEYLLFADGKRFGWEGGAMIRPRNDAAPDQAKELDALMSIYVGWR
ncbi:MAG TPA: hypothetical protein VLX92_29540 [Kofleriaceae bacterium]|nr:hypothetical protein [Kofleriaceae bacterium]